MNNDVIKAIEAVVAAGDEAIVKKERGFWVVIRNTRRLIYKEAVADKSDGTANRGCKS